MLEGFFFFLGSIFRLLGRCWFAWFGCCPIFSSNQWGQFPYNRHRCRPLNVSSLTCSNAIFFHQGGVMQSVQLVIV